MYREIRLALSRGVPGSRVPEGASGPTVVVPSMKRSGDPSVDRLCAGQLENRMAAAPHDREARSRERAIEFDALLPEGFLRREACSEAFVFACLHRDDFDLRVQRLAERRQHGDLAEARRVRGR